MSIIETKFRKGFVETPELRTNDLICNKIEYTGDLNKESLGLPIFDETDQEEGTWYPVAKDLVMNANPTGNAAFRNVEFPTNTGSLILPFNAKIKKITQPQRTDTGGDVSIRLECYMVLYGKKSDGSYHYICKSINKNVQQHQGPLLEWHFNNIEWNPKQEYEKLFISLAEVPYAIDENGDLILSDGNRVELDFLEAYGENGPLKHLHTESNGTKKFWVQSYTPIVIESGEKSYVAIKIGTLGSSGGSSTVMSTNSTGTQNFTPAFTITYTENELQPATIPHRENSQVHLTPSEKTKVLDVVPQFETYKQNLNQEFEEHKESIQEFLYGEPTAATEYDSKTVMGVTGTSAARIHFFFMGCENYTGTILQSITIPRPTNVALVGTGSTPDTAYVNPVWLYGLCYDENDEIIDTIVSENSAQQLPDDGYKTTWLFNNRIKATYKKIKFGISLTDTPTESDTNPENKTRIILCKTISKNGGWGTINQNNGNDSGLTLDFQFVLKKETNTNVKGHIENTEIHVTQADKDRWDRGNNADVQLTAGDFIDITDNAISVNTSSSLSESTNTVPTTAAVYAHSSDNTLHVTSSLTSEVAKISPLQTNVNNHIGDNTHLTSAQKESIEQISIINDSVSDVSEKIDNVNSILSVRTNVFSTLRDGLVAVNAGKMKTSCIQLSKKHFTTGAITTIEIPYYEGWDFQNTSPGNGYVNTDAEAYLAVQVFYDNEDDNTVKPLSQTYFSSNTQTQLYGTSGTMSFTFENLIIPNEYKFVRLMCVSDTSAAPDGRTQTNCLPFRVRVLSLESNNGDYTSFDDDDCKLFNSGGNYVAYVNVTFVTSILDSLENLNFINNSIVSHIGDDSHLTDAQKSAISQISEIEDKINDINFVLGVEKQEYTTFSSELPVPTDITNHDTSQIILASSRCVSGKIKKIEIPYTKGKGTTGYLAVQIIHSGESANIEKTLENTYFSTETQTQTNNQSGVSTFHFDNLFIPSDFYAIRFSFVSNKNTAPNYGGSNCLTYAIRMVSITESDYSNPVHNHDGYKIFNPETQGYSYSNTDYGVIVSVESVKSSFDFIAGELYRLKKVIS